MPEHEAQALYPPTPGPMDSTLNTKGNRTLQPRVATSGSLGSRSDNVVVMDLYLKSWTSCLRNYRDYNLQLTQLTHYKQKTDPEAECHQSRVFYHLNP